MELKYLIDKYNNFVIFTSSNIHSDIAKNMYSKPVAGGFCSLAIGYEQDAKGNEKRVLNIHCYGESISTGLKNREEDEKIINAKLNNHY